MDIKINWKNQDYIVKSRWASGEEWLAKELEKDIKLIEMASLGLEKIIESCLKNREYQPIFETAEALRVLKSLGIDKRLAYPLHQDFTDCEEVFKWDFRFFLQFILGSLIGIDINIDDIDAYKNKEIKKVRIILLSDKIEEEIEAIENGMGIDLFFTRMALEGLKKEETGEAISLKLIQEMEIFKIAQGDEEKHLIKDKDIEKNASLEEPITFRCKRRPKKEVLIFE